MKKTKLISCLLAGALIAASFAGCGDSSSAKKEDSALKQEQNQNQHQRETMAKVVSLEGDTITVILADMPKDRGGNGAPPSPAVTATDGAAKVDGAQPNGGITPPDGAMPPSNSAKPDDAAPPDAGDQPESGMPPEEGNSLSPASKAAIDSGGQGESQPGQSGGQSGDRFGQPGQGGGEITFTGEEVTYSLSDTVAVTKGMGENAEEMDLSEITVDSVITFQTETDKDGNEVITSIRVME